MAEKLVTDSADTGPQERVDEHGNVFRPGGWASIYSIPTPDGGRRVVYPPILIAPYQGSHIGEEVTGQELPQVAVGNEQPEYPVVHQDPPHQT